MLENLGEAAQVARNWRPKLQLTAIEDHFERQVTNARPLDRRGRQAIGGGQTGDSGERREQLVGRRRPGRRRSTGSRRGPRPGGRRGSRAGAARACSLRSRAQRPAEHVEPGLRAADHDDVRTKGPQGAAEPPLGQLGREQQNAKPGAAQEELECLDVDPLDAQRRARVEQQNALRRGSRGGDKPPGAVQPPGRPTAGVLELGGAVFAPRGQVERGQQDLRDGAFDRPDGEALLELAIGGRLVEAVEGDDQPRRRRRAAAAQRGRPRRRSRCCGSRAAPREAPRPRSSS